MPETDAALDMFTKHITGTRAQIVRALKEATLPPSQVAPEAVLRFAEQHIPDGTRDLWQVSLSCETIHNPSWDTVAGHLTVTVQRTERS